MTVRLWVLASVAAAVLWVTGASPRSDRTGPPRDLHWAIDLAPQAGLVAFALTGDARIYLLDLATGDLEGVAVSGTPRHPVIAPDGRHVAYQAPGRLMLLARDSGDEIELAVDPKGWSPSPYRAGFSGDGARLAYVTRRGSAESARYELRLRDLSGATPERVLWDAPEPLEAPAFAPVGSALAFLVGADLWVVDDATDASPTPIVRVGAEGERVAPGVSALGIPSWSEDGRSLAYAAPVLPCGRVVVVDDVEQRWWRFALPEMCGRAPAWVKGDYRLVFLRDPTGPGELGSTLWSHALYDGWSGALGFSNGHATSFRLGEDGTLVIAGSPGDQPLALWRISPQSHQRTLGEPVLLRWPPGAGVLGHPSMHTVELAAGATVEVQVYPRRRYPVVDERKPAAVWNPDSDRAPPWTWQVRALTASGIVTIVPRRRASAEELRVIAEWTRRRKDVSGGAVAIVWGNSLPSIDLPHAEPQGEHW